MQIGAHLGARVIAVGRGDAKMAQAVALGAHSAVRSDAGASAIVEAAGGQIDVVLQAVGESVAMDRLAIDIAGFGGRVVFVGVSQDSFPVYATELIWREIALLGSRGFNRQDIREVIELVRTGALSTQHLTGTQRPLLEADEALRDLREGRVLRTVLIPGNLSPLRKDQ